MRERGIDREDEIELSDRLRRIGEVQQGAAEVMVDGTQAYVVRAREEVQQLFAGETILPA